MIHYLIYFSDNKKNDHIMIKDTYKNKNDAIINVEKIAFEYVKKIEGEKQMNVCKQEKTPEQILDDPTLRNGLYIIKTNNVVSLYEKYTQTIPGTIWNGYKNVIDKIGIFGMIEYKIDDTLVRCACSISPPIHNGQKTPIEIKSVNFLDELNKVIGDTNGKFNLRSNKQIV